MSNPNLLVLLLAPALMCSVVNSVQFQLKPSHPKCFSEDLKSNVITVGNYNVVNPNDGYPIPDSHKITVRVRSPYGNGYHYANNVYSGDFAFTAAEDGDYNACFSVPSDLNPEEIVTVDFVWRTGVAAKDWSKVAKKGQIEEMELELKKLYDAVSSIHDEMFYLREREVEMQDLNEDTNTRMFTFSFVSILVCLSVAGLQLWHLKTFFERKKLL
ncbi:Transmembrane emp24 domain-containing protein p24delta9 [Spatholobus suberectus]|nr:Transmembrane emp24 domain-containing protein p24delta9 [Spatholobus suberectus]